MQLPVTKRNLLRLRALSTSATSSNPWFPELTCLALLHSCDTIPKLLQLHAQILKSGLRYSAPVLTKFASKSSDLNSIHLVDFFIFSPESDLSLYDTFLYNTVIRAYAQSANFKARAISTYSLMLQNGVWPNNFTYPFVLKACAGIHCLLLGHSVHGSVLKFGFHTDGHVQNTMVHMYCSCDRGIESARKVFDEMPTRGSVPWSAMIGGYTRLGQARDAVELFRKMQLSGVRPDEFTMVSVLSACTDLGALELGQWIESYIERQQITKSVELCNALIDMFCKCGDVDKALNLFRKMERRTVVSWTTVILGLGMHGRGLETVSLFEEMVRHGVMPDDVAFLGLLSACSHSGLVDKGRQYFESMWRDFGLKPKIQHYGCVVDLLCRAGHVTEAIDFVQMMEFPANSVIWRTLVNACRAHGKLKLGEDITQHLISNEPAQEANYVLLSNIYARMLKWDKKSLIREEMGKRDLSKNPGRTMAELNNEIYELIVADKP